MEASDPLRIALTESRRHIVFAWSVFVAGLVITAFCLMPVIYPDRHPRSFFQNSIVEDLFFDVFAVSSGCWLFSWAAAVNGWKMATKAGQWLGITLICLNQALLLGVWWDLLQQPQALSSGLWAVPWLIQGYILGCFVGFFTMPELTLSGNRSLTALGTLAILLPWLVGRREVLVGTQILNSEILRFLGG